MNTPTKTLPVIGSVIRLIGGCNHGDEYIVTGFARGNTVKEFVRGDSYVAYGEGDLYPMGKLIRDGKTGRKMRANKYPSCRIEAAYTVI